MGEGEESCRGLLVAAQDTERKQGERERLAEEEERGKRKRGTTCGVPAEVEGRKKMSSPRRELGLHSCFFL